MTPEERKEYEERLEREKSVKNSLDVLERLKKEEDIECDVKSLTKDCESVYSHAFKLLGNKNKPIDTYDLCVLLAPTIKERVKTFGFATSGLYFWERNIDDKHTRFYNKIKKENKERYFNILRKRKVLNKKSKKVISKNAIKIGMKMCEVYAILGRASTRNTTINKYGKSVQHIFKSGYTSGIYVYSENDIVTGIQY